MKSFLIWFFGTLGAFAFTAGAFLLLANLGSGASERNLEPPSPSSSIRLPLELGMDEDQLETLEARTGQNLTVVVSNGSSSPFSEVSLTLRVSSEDTALGRARYYRAKVENLGAGDSEPVRFPIDLSPISGSREGESYQPGGQERSRVVLEAQATTPEGISTVKTAVLPFSNGNST